MKIIDILKLPHGECISGFTLKAEHTHKSNNDKIKRVTFQDETGSILAEISSLIPIVRRMEIEIDEAYVIWSGDTTLVTLDVTHFKILTDIGQPSVYENYPTPPDWDKIALGKTRCRIVCAYIQSGTEPEVERVNYWTNFVMKGK